MYEEMELLCPSSQYFSHDISSLENLWQLNKEILSGDLGESVTVTELDLESGDLFKAPITSDESAHEHQHMAISIEPQQNMTEDEIDLLQITRLNELLLYASDDAQVLENSVIEPAPPTSPLMATQMNSPESSLINSSNAKVTSTEEEVPLDSKTVSICQTSQALALPTIIKNSTDHSISASKENVAAGDPTCPAPVNPQRPPQMQRSLSSDALGQMGTIPPVNCTSLCPQFYPSCYSLGQQRRNPDPVKQTQLSSIQRLNMNPPFRSMKRVYSTGDIGQTQSIMQMCHGSTIPLESGCSNFEGAGLKIGHYTMEERKQRIHKYRKKRTKRNFNRKIKYACRKSLADRQPRVRGRFAPKNENVGGSTATPNGHHEEGQEEAVEYRQRLFWPSNVKSTIPKFLSFFELCSV